MKVARLTQVKNDLSRYVEHVRRGGRVRILVRGVPVADLVPVGDGAKRKAAGDDWNLDELERRGIIRRGTGGIPREILRPAPKVWGKPLSAMVTEERRSSRR